MLERAALALLIIGLGLLAVRLGNRVLLRRSTGAPGLEQLQPGLPAILLFSSPDCRPCHTVQRPTIERLIEELPHAVQLVEIDVYERPDLADYWGVLSLPTTFIIDGQRRPRRVNHGLANRAKLIQQLQQVGAEVNPVDGAAERASARAIADQTDVESEKRPQGI